MQWWRAGPDGQQVGPLTESALQAERKAGAISDDTLVWHAGLPGWMPLQQALGGAGEAAAAGGANSADVKENWFYAGAEGARCGPVPRRQFMQLAKSGAVHAGTLVWHASLPEWLPLSTVPELSSLLEAAAAAEAAAAKPPPAAKAAKGKAGTGPGQGARKRPRGDAPGCLYISGLPGDVSEGELAAFVKAVGIVRQNPLTEQLCIKVYRDEEAPGRPCKGDAVVQFLRRPSVTLAITLLDGKPLREGGPPLALQPASATPAAFNAGAAGGGGKRPRLSERERQILAVRGREQDAQLSWSHQGEYDRSTGGYKMVIISGMFSVPSPPPDLPGPWVAELAEEVRGECEAKCGKVDKVRVFWSNPDGCVLVKFLHGGAASECLRLMSGRLFDGRTLKCILFDGVTDYRGPSERAAGKAAKAIVKGEATAPSAAAALDTAAGDDGGGEGGGDSFGKWLEEGGGEKW